MRTRTLLPILLVIILIVSSCGGDDDDSETTAAPETTEQTDAVTEPPDGEEEHECLISADLVRVEFDFEELWDAERIAQIIEDSLPPILPDWFLDVLPEPPPFGTIYVPEEASGLDVAFAVLPDGRVFDNEGNELQPRSGMQDLLLNMQLGAELGEGLVPAESIDPFGQELVDSAVWSSDGSIVELKYPDTDTAYRYDELVPTTDLANFIAEVNSELIRDGAALDSGILLSQAELVERVGLAPGSAHFLPATSYVQLPPGVASVADVVKSAGAVGGDVVSEATSSMIAKVDGYLDEAPEEFEWDPTPLREYLTSPEDVDVEPIYALAFEGHWSLEPGAEEFQPVAENSTQYTSAAAAVSSLDAAVSPEDSARVVAIIDSGFPSEGWPGLDVGLTDYDKQDEAGVPSHGLFVASLIRQLAPDARVIGLRVDVLSGRIVSTDGSVFVRLDEESGGYRFADSATGEIAALTDEDMVVGALNRLETLLGKDSADFINLSMGTYACPGSYGVPEPTAIRDELKDSWPSAVVFAAAGNEALNFKDHHGSNFYPAAFDEIIGVAASDTDGNLWAWDEDKERVQAADENQPASVDTAALGIDVVGVAGAEMGVWSGSSFATAIVSGFAANSAEPDGATLENEALKCPAGATHAVPRLDGQKLATDQEGKRIYEDFKSCQN